jgi:hypothetical protein
MNTQETIVAPDATTLNPASEVTETPEIVTPEEAVGQEPQEEAKPQMSDAEKEVKALKRRIDRMTQQKYQLSAENETLRRQPAEQTRQEQPDFSQLTPAQVDALIEQRADERLSSQTQMQRTSVIDAQLQKKVGAALPEFYAEIQSAGKAGASLVNAAIELDDAADVLAYLSKDSDELDKVLALSPIKQAAHLGRLSARIEAEKSAPKRSNAPIPLSPVKGAARSSEPDINDTARWIKWSNEQDANKRKR